MGIRRKLHDGVFVEIPRYGEQPDIVGIRRFKWHRLPFGINKVMENSPIQWALDLILNTDHAAIRRCYGEQPDIVGIRQQIRYSVRTLDHQWLWRTARYSGHQTMFLFKKITNHFFLKVMENSPIQWALDSRLVHVFVVDMRYGEQPEIAGIKLRVFTL